MPTAVCFRKRNKDVVTFNAQKTRAPCKKQWEKYDVVTKNTNDTEYRALKQLKTAGAQGVPKLLYGKPKAGGRADVRMTKVGTALTDIPGRRSTGGRQLVKQNHGQLKRDLHTAYTTMKKAGVLHQDMAPRNVTWDGHHFHVIDFDIVEFRNDWDVDSEVEEAMDGIMTWANKA